MERTISAESRLGNWVKPAESKVCHTDGPMEEEDAMEPVQFTVVLVGSFEAESREDAAQQFVEWIHSTGTLAVVVSERELRIDGGVEVDVSL